MNNNIPIYIMVRAENNQKAERTILDMKEYANIELKTTKVLPPDTSDMILVDVMNDTLKQKCKYACITYAYENAKEAIRKVKTIHPPGHIVVVSNKYKVYNEIVKTFDTLQEFTFTIKDKDISTIDNNKDEIETENKNKNVSMQKNEQKIYNQNQTEKPSRDFIRCLDCNAVTCINSENIENCDKCNQCGGTNTTLLTIGADSYEELDEINGITFTNMK